MVTKHQNEVLLDSEHIKSATYIPNSFMATKGQPADSAPKIKMEGGSVAIVMGSGRKKSKPVAQRFIELSGDWMFAPLGGQDGKPKELNFMFGLDIVFNDGSTTKIYLGQGSTGSFRNNWWIGSPDLKIANPAKLLNYIVSGTDLKTDIGEMVDSIEVPPKYKAIADFFEMPIKHFTQKVNVFKIT